MKKCMLLHNLVRRFMKNNIAEKHNSGLKLMKIDIDCMSNSLLTSDLNISIAAKCNL